MARAKSTLTDKALVLGRTPWSESSLVVHVLTERHGPVRLAARGAYRKTSRLFCKLDLFDTLEIRWREPRLGVGLGDMSDAEVLVRRRRPRRDLNAYEAALTSLELTALAARPGDSDGGLFRLMQGTLDALEDPDLRPALALVRFELGFLAEMGIPPSLRRCASCDRAAPAEQPASGGCGPRVAFSAGAGGRLCSACAIEARRSGRRVGSLPAMVLEAAADLAQGTLPDPSRMDDLVPRLRDFIGRFLDYHLEHRPRSHRRFLARANRNAPAST